MTETFPPFRFGDSSQWSSPVKASELILKLRDMLGLTVVMVSHDLKSIYDTLDRLAVIDDKIIVAEGGLHDVISMDIPFIQTFFKADI